MSPHRSLYRNNRTGEVCHCAPAPGWSGAIARSVARNSCPPGFDAGWVFEGRLSLPTDGTLTTGVVATVLPIPAQARRFDSGLDSRQPQRLRETHTALLCDQCAVFPARLEDGDPCCSRCPATPTPRALPGIHIAIHPRQTSRVGIHILNSSSAH